MEKKTAVEQSIDLIAIENICGKGYEFFIPDYQRGYRWGKEQVDKLLDDIDEFMNSKNKSESDTRIYLLQPLVVKEEERNDVKTYSVIDGQQRLTTVKILLSYLQEQQTYNVEYETRTNSKAFLDTINTADDAENQAEANADFYHIYHAKEAIDEWFKEKDDDYKKRFLEMLKGKVYFVWYETKDPDPIKAFTRLNKGKISLTDSELIKALFLSNNNFRKNEAEENKLLTLLEIANEWDKIEYRLQDDRFWLFFHELEYRKPTRIDFILDMVRALGNEAADGASNNANKTQHETFDYYYKRIAVADNKQKQITNLWKEINKIYMTLEEWYNDEELYHYIGFLCACNAGKKGKAFSAQEYIKTYFEKKTKEAFLETLKTDIQSACGKFLDVDFEYENGKNKKNAKPILLLHNIQTILDQNKSIVEEEKYGLPDFVRFPFHQYKKEGWDIEHIRPNVALDYEHDYEGSKKGKERAKYVYLQENRTDRDKYKAEIEKYDKCTAADEEGKAFKELWDKINEDGNGELPEVKKNLIWNYALLDSGTNRAYGNSCFEIKRGYVIKKERGIKPELKVKGDKLPYEVELFEEKEAAFVPICTKNIFLKVYTDFPDNLKYWTKKDAAYYRFDIEKNLWWYLFKPLDPKKTSDPFVQFRGLNDDDRKALFDSYKKEVLEGKNYDKSFKTWYKEKSDKKNGGKGGD